MIIIYKKVSKKQIAKDVKETTPKLEQWFVDNPKRRICRATLWYGRMVGIRRGHVPEDVRAAASAANGGGDFHGRRY